MSASLEGRPVPRRTVQLLSRIDPALKKRLARFAETHRKPQTRVVEDALRALLDAKEQHA